MFYEDLQIKLLKLLQDNWNRVISFDLETCVLDPSHFLRDERVLSISLARRVSGEFTEGKEIMTKTLFLEKEDDESEKDLLEQLDEELSKIKPLGVIGYGLRQYDLPLLIMKKQRYKLLLWKLIDMTESAIHVDLYHVLKYKRYKKLDQVLSSPEFAHLPLSRTKGTVTSDRSEKGKEIYRLWKQDRAGLKRYAEGDAHDLLLIAESIAFK